MNDANLKVTAFLGSPIVFGDPIMLDGIVEFMVHRRIRLRAQSGCPEAQQYLRWEEKIGLPEHRIFDKTSPIYPAGLIHTPIKIERLNGYVIPKCSNPILSPDAFVFQDQLTSRLENKTAAEFAGGKRMSISYSSGKFRANFKKFSVIRLSKIVWFCRASGANAGKERVQSARRNLLRILKQIHSIGSKRRMGYGLVTRWEVERIESDFSWYAPTDGGQWVLMRQLPVEVIDRPIVGGYQTVNVGIAPPYWHPDRKTDAVVPC